MIATERKYFSRVTLIMISILFLTLFNVILRFGNILFPLFKLNDSIPLAGLIVNFDLLFLAGLLLVLYRRWKEEVIRRKSNEETLLPLQKAVENMQIGVTITDPKGKILYVNSAEAEIHGYAVEDLIGKDARIFGPPETRRPLVQPLLKRFSRESFNIRKDGSAFPVQLMSDAVTTPDGSTFAIITTCEDITERKRNEEMIKRLAFYDGLTGLPNRELFSDRLNQELAKGRRHKQSFAVMFIDLDRFKNVNDTLGHDTGDLLLKAVAARLKNITREDDTVSRLSGDEFVIIFPNIGNIGGISSIAKKVLANLSEAFTVNEAEMYVTASIGISIFPADGDSADILVRNADAAMYYAKEQGRNNYQFYSPAINANAEQKMKMQSDLRRAARENEFIVHYQPQIDLRSGRIVGAEALARWQHPEYGLLSPGEFISLAEETGLISSIGEQLLFDACAQNKAWQQAGHAPIRVAVNISTYHFIQKNFLNKLRRVLDETGLEPEYLDLEFTESIVMENSDIVSNALQELKSLGVHCSIDDFGTGYSSLSYLKYIPISKLKLDRSFVQSLAVNFSDAAISRAIIRIAHDLNLRVTAEGVENVEQLEFLRSHSCDEAQGFLFSKPVPAEDFGRLLGADSRYGEYGLRLDFADPARLMQAFT